MIRMADTLSRASVMNRSNVFREVSILSPVGLALIGKKLHGIAKVNMPMGYIEYLKIMSVEHNRNAQLR
ncbi:GreA/GreB family elongation factor [Noviherbaspirillum sedimenti]|uniref:Uncharacterized protein n=1 Tax=Noviherbaspirillum sedimenti TaxID=2320865 RepID=A0A3A3G3D1_9BURK|nr:GreA/GreB family elongation factor [Noviherbaspirillum sedimenti]RJG02441.1 hypothetical protein D3878_13350 [Noviherbaspirillum sedimenti]